ncbi:hypothetical protein RB619_12240 [Flavobacterium sp. LHD-80]|uniref:hypothetical protein n=1 Tax=Flavobacterium sp. LHD-80 TaxID=3071411 RepID=UPI0027E0B81F|nr:hypothetical protein [Flavobacterium sp. LHD-80]MDQ6471416.1 hypothetical protein [Flavobacterium sp. LHD-80]
MKIKKTIFLTFCVALMSVSSILAFQTTAPDPPTKPDKPPGSPIDQNLFILAGCAVLFGVYAIRRYDFIKKDSIKLNLFLF